MLAYFLSVSGDLSFAAAGIPVCDGPLKFLHPSFLCHLNICILLCFLLSVFTYATIGHVPDSPTGITEKMAPANSGWLSPAVMLSASHRVGMHVLDDGRLVDYLRRPPVDARPPCHPQLYDRKAKFSAEEVVLLQRWMACAEVEDITTNFAFETLEAVVGELSSVHLRGAKC